MVPAPFVRLTLHGSGLVRPALNNGRTGMWSRQRKRRCGKMGLGECPIRVSRCPTPARLGLSPGSSPEHSYHCDFIRMPMKYYLHPLFGGEALPCDSQEKEAKVLLVRILDYVDWQLAQKPSEAKVVETGLHRGVCTHRCLGPQQVLNTGV